VLVIGRDLVCVSKELGGCAERRQVRKSIYDCQRLKSLGIGFIFFNKRQNRCVFQLQVLDKQLERIFNHVNNL
jgi:hypothetical protein